MSSDRDERAERARRRRTWPVQVKTLQAPENDDLSATTTPVEASHMSNRWAAALFLAASPAAAIGLCEDVKHAITVEAQSAKMGAFIARHDAETCKETDTGEDRVAWRFFDVLDAKGAVLRTFVEGDVARFRTAWPRETPVEPATAMAAFLEANGFAPATPAPQSANGRCRVDVVRVHRGEDETSTRLRIHGDGRVLVAQSLAPGTAAPEALAWYLPGLRTIAVRVRLPVGGPPPGYFGGDDPGTSYTKDVLRVFPAAQRPALAACFETPPP
jgi:hypothetical protein